MLISMNWINEFVDLKGLDLDNLIHRFTLSTAEVEDIFHMGENLTGVVTAKILSVEQHPKKEKIHMLKVDKGDEVVDIVCGAPNVREGLIVPLATDGANVNGYPIKVAKVYGYMSHGMCCSESELGISADNSGLMELPEDTPLGVDIRDIYDIRDTVFEVDNKSLTNRPDLWGHYGIAREFSALTGRPLKPFDRVNSKAFKNLPKVDIDIRDKQNCFRYTSVKVENVTVPVSPVNMRIRLHYCGTRAINLLADLTNYLMLELGQPMHAFDLRKVDKIEVQRFDKPFTFQTLDDAERSIDPETLMITSHDEPVAIAGIMGGLASEIEDDTTSLLLESATFDAVSIRKSATRLGMRTDASARYEKTLDPENTLPAVERYLWLLQQIDPDAKVISAVTDNYARKYKKISLDFDKKYVDRYTGIKITNARIIKTLEALGFTVRHEKNNFSVDVPSWRATKDVTIKADIIEEITRIYGYDNFEIKTAPSPLYPVREAEGRRDDFMVKNLLADRFSLHEVHSYIWADSKKFREIGIEVEENVKLVNSINPDQIVIRNSIVPTLLSMTAENKLFDSSFGIFEIGRVVEGLKADGLCNERKKLGVILYSKTESEKEIYLKLKDILLTVSAAVKGGAVSLRSAEKVSHAWQHPVNTAEIVRGDEVLGFITAVHPAVCAKIDKKAAVVALELDMDALSAQQTAGINYADPSKFPEMDIDLTLLLEKGAQYGTVKEIVETVESDILKGVTLADVYEGAELNGARAVTIRLTFSSDERTLSGDEVQAEVTKVLDALNAQGIKMR